MSKKDVPHLACIVCNTHCPGPSESRLTLGEMHGILALLSQQFGCEAYSEHLIKPVSLYDVLSFLGAFSV